MNAWIITFYILIGFGTFVASEIEREEQGKLSVWYSIGSAVIWPTIISALVVGALIEVVNKAEASK